MSCNIFNLNFLDQINFNELSSNELDLSPVRALISGYNTSISGIWQPIIVDRGRSKVRFVDPLIQVNTNLNKQFQPCNCNVSQLNTLNKGFYNNTEEQDLDTPYCCRGNSIPLIENDALVVKSCDFKLHNDDFLPKVPILNQSYVSSFYDFKYHKEFPACNNPCLGFEKILSVTGELNFCIDWKMKESISEIEYSKTTSYHINEYAHNKSYQKSQMVSNTCGNFILLSIDPIVHEQYLINYSIFNSLNSSRIIPEVEDFTKPYGFDNQTYNNIFIDRKKMASYWKWNYTSGVLGWYRYYDINRINDKRPISGIDLYISPGDVFYATNDGPEPSTSGLDLSIGPALNPSTPLTLCPSGLKIVEGQGLSGIVPSGSQFIYISQNLYKRFFNFYTTYTELGFDHDKSLSLSALMCTAPLYDKFTTDLLSKEGRNNYNNFNTFEQIDILNKYMLRGTEYKSVDDLYYISSKESLIKTLYSKYGGYVWIPPNTSKDISLNAGSSNSIYVDLDFDMCLDSRQVKFANINSKKFNVCQTDPLAAINKKFTYDQNFSFGDTTISAKLDPKLRYSNSCDNANVTYSIYGALFYNNESFKSFPVFDGVSSFRNRYTDIINVPSQDPILELVPPEDITVSMGSDPKNTDPIITVKITRSLMQRNYKALAFNPHLDLLAFHPDGGIYFNAGSFGEFNNTVFNKNVSNTRGGNININFRTDDVGIKLYNIDVKKLQSNTRGTEQCERFPVETVDKKCKCYGLNLEQYNNHPLVCNEPRTNYSTSPFFIPNLSTKYSPAIRASGGRGAILPIITNKLDPSNPYNCDQSTDIALQNYTTISYGLTLKNFNTNHSDIVVTAYEDITLSDSFDPEAPPPPPKRFVNEIKINDLLTLYADQEKILYRSNEPIPSVTRISLTNPFLNALMDNANLSLGFLCFDAGQRRVADWTSFEKRRYENELSTTVLKFRQKPRKQILSFKVINNPILQNPNCCPWWSNIINQARLGNERATRYVLGFPGKTLANPGPCPIDGLLACEKDVVVGGPYISIKKASYNSINGVSYGPGSLDDTPLLDTGEIRYSSSTDGQKILLLEVAFGLDYYFERILNQISSFNQHRKLKLYISTNTGWYSSKIPSRGGYVLSDTTYIGNPRFFDYIRNPLISLKKPFLVPAPPKKPILLDYLLHTQPNLETQAPDIIAGGIDYFPKTIANLWNNITDYKQWPKKGRFWDPIFTDDPRIVRFKGIRPYFRIPENRNIFDLSEINSLEELVATQRAFDLGDFIKLKGTGYFVYVGPTLNDVKNYIFIGTNPNILKKYSNLDIDLTNYSSTGYVFDTYVACNTEVDLFRVSDSSGPFLLPRDKNNRPLFRTVGSNVIVGKRIFVKFFNKDGIEISSSSNENIYIKIYTEFIFRDKINQEFNLIWFNQSSIVIYDDDTPSTERDVLLSNKKYNTKWGDLVKYDNILLNNPHIPSYNELPETTYNNLFYKQIVNDQKNNFTFSIDNNSSPLVLNYTENNRPYFCIYQKYNLDDESVWSIDTDIYHNYLPFMEINLSDKIPDIYTSGNFQSSVLYNIYNINEFTPKNPQIVRSPNPDLPEYPYAQYWIFNPIDNFEAAFIPNETVKYLPSLRIDDPLFILHRTLREDKTTSRDDVREIFKPSLTNLQTFENDDFIIPSNFRRNLINRRTPFISRLAYADIDKPKQGETSNSSCGPDVCTISTAGSIDLKSQYAVYEPRNITYDQLPNSMIGFIGYDGGLYNSIGDRFISIVRTESFVDEERGIDSPAESNITCNTFKPIPTNSSNIFSSIYQDYIERQETSNTIVHSANVEAMDKHANEMLFRILYGEQSQKINKKQLFIDNQILTADDLVNYVEPIITPAALYDQILYNYDKSTIQNIAVTGNIIIKGTKKIGDNINVSINNQNISLSIVNINNNIVLTGRIGSERINEIIYRNSLIENRLLSVEYTDEDPGEIGSPNENTSMVLLASRTIETKYIGSFWDVSLGEGYCPLDSPIFEPGPECYGETDEAPIILDLPGCKETCIRIGNDFGVSTSFVGGPVFNFGDWTTNYLRGCEPSKPYDPFIYGYCRAADTSNADESNPVICSNCENYDGVEGALEFDYTFQKCSTTFNLKGHAYRVKIGPKIPVPRPPPPPGPPPLYATNTCKGNIGVDGFVWGCTYPSWGGRGGGGAPDLCGGKRFPGDTLPLDQCCISTWGNPWKCVKSSPVTTSSSVTRKVYKMSTTIQNPPYTALVCPQNFLNISYTNDKIVINLINPNKTYCLPINNRGCPNIDINIPSDYIVSDNVDGSCDTECKKIEIELLPENNTFNFEYRDYTIVEDFGGSSYGDVQGGDIMVTNGSWGTPCNDVPAWCPPTCVGRWISLCGGGQPWASPLGGYYGFGSEDAHNSWLINTRTAFDNLATHPARVTPAIPTEDIVEGIIPGTMALNFRTYTFDIPKAKQVSRDEVVYSTYPAVLTIAYITYQYRKAITVNDYLLGLSGYDFTQIIEEERSFSSAFNIKYNHPKSAGGLGAPMGLPLPQAMCGGRVGESYKQLQPVYKKDACDNSPTCYNNETYDRNQTLCNYEDWMCWSGWSGPLARYRACILNRRLPPSSNEMWV